MTVCVCRNFCFHESHLYQTTAENQFDAPWKSLRIFSSEALFVWGFCWAYVNSSLQSMATPLPIYFLRFKNSLLGKKDILCEFQMSLLGKQYHSALNCCFRAPAQNQHFFLKTLTIIILCIETNIGQNLADKMFS